jgi:hypothetical protein
MLAAAATVRLRMIVEPTHQVQVKDSTCTSGVASTIVVSKSGLISREFLVTQDDFVCSLVYLWSLPCRIINHQYQHRISAPSQRMSFIYTLLVRPMPWSKPWSTTSIAKHNTVEKLPASESLLTYSNLDENWMDLVELVEEKGESIIVAAAAAAESRWKLALHFRNLPSSFLLFSTIRQTRQLFPKRNVGWLHRDINLIN